MRKINRAISYLTGVLMIVAGCATPTPNVTSSGLKAVTLTILVQRDFHDHLKKPYEVTIIERSQLERLLKIIDASTPVPMHKCANVGSLKLVYDNAPPVWMDLYPGHESGAYEIQGAEGQLFRIHRADFFEVLAEAGADTSRMPL